MSVGDEKWEKECLNATIFKLKCLGDSRVKEQKKVN
jgi:hypothetical protein